MTKKLEMKKGPPDCYKAAKLSPTPPFASIWSPLSSGIQVIRSLFGAVPLGLGPSGHTELCSAGGKAAIWTGMKTRFPGDHVSSSSSLHPSAISNSNPLPAFWGCLWPFLINHHMYYWGTYCQAHFVPLEHPLAFSFPQYMGHLVNVLYIQRAFTYM